MKQQYGWIEGVPVADGERTRRQQDGSAVRSESVGVAVLIGNQGDENGVPVRTRQGWVLALSQPDDIQVVVGAGQRTIAGLSVSGDCQCECYRKK